HYQKIDAKRWMSRSTMLSVREFRDAKRLDDSSEYPEGEDHGLLWRTNTFWFAREREGGLDLQIESITLSRIPPLGFVLWGNRRVRDTVEKMLRDTKAAVESSRLGAPPTKDSHGEPLVPDSPRGVGLVKNSMRGK